MTDQPQMDPQILAAILKGGGLPPTQENQFQQSMFMEPGWRDWRRDFMRSYGGQQPNTAPGGDYNYRLAWALGAKPQLDPASGTFHGLSSAEMSPRAQPVDLKAPNHPTAWKETFMRKFDQNPDMVEQWTPDMAAMAFGNLKKVRR